MAQTVYAVPGVTPQGQELTSKEEALRLADAHGSAVFAYRKSDDGSLTLLGAKTRRGKVIEYKNNPLRDFKAPPFHYELRRMGQTGHTVYRDLSTGVETKKPKMVYFAEPGAALQALAVYLVLEGVDTRGAVDMTTDRAHRKMAAIRLPNGDIFSATLSPEGNDYWIQAPGLNRMLRWGTWALAGQYPTTKAGLKQNPQSPNHGYWVHIRPDKTFSAVKTGPGRAKFRETAEQYLRSQGLNPAALQRGGYGADYSHGNERGSYYWDTPAGANILAFWYDLNYISNGYKRTNPKQSMAPLHFASFRGHVQVLRHTLSRKPSRERSNDALDCFMGAISELAEAQTLDPTVGPEGLEKDPDFKALMQFRAELVRAHYQYSKQA